MSAVLCLPACLCVSAAASRGQAPHGNASLSQRNNFPHLNNHPGEWLEGSRQSQQDSYQKVSYRDYSLIPVRMYH